MILLVIQMSGGTKYRMQNKRGNIILTMLLLSAALVTATALLRPAYLRYMDEDHAVTCGTARYIMVRWYADDVEQQRGAGQGLNEIDYDQTLQERLEQFQKDFPYFHAEKLTREEVGRLHAAEDGLVVTPDPEATYRITGMCRGGGTDLLTMDADSHKLDIACSIHGEYHIDFEPFE